MRPKLIVLLLFGIQIQIIASTKEENVSLSLAKIPQILQEQILYNQWQEKYLPNFFNINRDTNESTTNDDEENRNRLGKQIPNDIINQLKLSDEYLHSKPNKFGDDELLFEKEFDPNENTQSNTLHQVLSNIFTKGMPGIFHMSYPEDEGPNIKEDVPENKQALKKETSTSASTSTKVTDLEYVEFTSEPEPNTSKIPIQVSPIPVLPAPIRSSPPIQSSSTNKKIYLPTIPPLIKESFTPTTIYHRINSLNDHLNPIFEPTIIPLPSTTEKSTSRHRPTKAPKFVYTSTSIITRSTTIASSQRPTPPPHSKFMPSTNIPKVKNATKSSPIYTQTFSISMSKNAQKAPPTRKVNRTKNIFSSIKVKNGKEKSIVKDTARDHAQARLNLITSQDVQQINDAAEAEFQAETKLLAIFPTIGPRSILQLNSSDYNDLQNSQQTFVEPIIVDDDLEDDNYVLASNLSPATLRPPTSNGNSIFQSRENFIYIPQSMMVNSDRQINVQIIRDEEEQKQQKKFYSAEPAMMDRFQENAETYFGPKAMPSTTEAPSRTYLKSYGLQQTNDNIADLTSIAEEKYSQPNPTKVSNSSAINSLLENSSHSTDTISKPVRNRGKTFVEIQKSINLHNKFITEQNGQFLEQHEEFQTMPYEYFKIKHYPKALKVSNSNNYNQPSQPQLSQQPPPQQQPPQQQPPQQPPSQQPPTQQPSSQPPTQPPIPEQRPLLPKQSQYSFKKSPHGSIYVQSPVPLPKIMASMSENNNQRNNNNNNDINNNKNSINHNENNVMETMQPPPLPETPQEPTQKSSQQMSTNDKRAVNQHFIPTEVNDQPNSLTPVQVPVEVPVPVQVAVPVPVEGPFQIPLALEMTQNSPSYQHIGVPFATPTDQQLYNSYETVNNGNYQIPMFFLHPLPPQSTSTNFYYQQNNEQNDESSNPIQRQPEVYRHELSPPAPLPPLPPQTQSNRFIYKTISSNDYSGPAHKSPLSNVEKFNPTNYNQVSTSSHQQRLPLPPNGKYSSITTPVTDHQQNIKSYGGNGGPSSFFDVIFNWNKPTTNGNKKEYYFAKHNPPQPSTPPPPPPPSPKAPPLSTIQNIKQNLIGLKSTALQLFQRKKPPIKQTLESPTYLHPNANGGRQQTIGIEEFPNYKNGKQQREVSSFAIQNDYFGPVPLQNDYSVWLSNSEGISGDAGIGNGGTNANGHSRKRSPDLGQNVRFEYGFKPPFTPSLEIDSQGNPK